MKNWILVALLAGCGHSKPPVELVSLEAPPALKQELLKSEQTSKIDLSSLPFYAVGPVADVNGKVISAFAYNEVIHGITILFPERIDILWSQRYQILDDLVYDELMARTVGETIDEIPSVEVNQRFEAWSKVFKNVEGGKEAFYRETTATEERLKREFATQIAMERFLTKAYAVTDDQVTQYYFDNPREFEIEGQVKASHILVKVRRNADDNTIINAQKKAYQIYKKAKKARADFAELAKKYSEGPSRKKGGALGFFHAKRMVTPFSNAAFAMKIGEVSKPVRTQFGWHIIKVFDKKPAETIPLSEAMAGIRKRLTLNLRALKKKFIAKETIGLNIVKYKDDIMKNPDF